MKPVISKIRRSNEHRFEYGQLHFHVGGVKATRGGNFRLRVTYVPDKQEHKEVFIRILKSMSKVQSLIVEVERDVITEATSDLGTITFFLIYNLYDQRELFRKLTAFPQDKGVNWYVVDYCNNTASRLAYLFEQYLLACKIKEHGLLQGAHMIFAVSNKTTNERLNAYATHPEDISHWIYQGVQTIHDVARQLYGPEWVLLPRELVKNLKVPEVPALQAVLKAGDGVAVYANIGKALANIQ